MINFKDIYKVLKTEDEETADFILDEIEAFLKYEPEIINNKNFELTLFKENDVIYFELSYLRVRKLTARQLKVYKYKYLKNKFIIDDTFWVDNKEVTDINILSDNIHDILIDTTKELYHFGKHGKSTSIKEMLC